MNILVQLTVFCIAIAGSVLALARSFVFIPSNWYFRVLKKIKSQTAERYKVYTDKELRRIKKQEKNEEEFNNLARRMGYVYTYNTSVLYVNKQLPTAVILALLYNIVTIKLIFPLSVPDPAVRIAVGLLSVVGSVAIAAYTGCKPFLDVKFNTKQLNIDTINEFYLLITVFRNSGEKATLFSTIYGFIPTANALRDDLAVLVQDMDIFGMPEALDRLAVRLNMPVIYDTVFQLKATLEAGYLQRQQVLQIMEDKIVKYIDETAQKDSKKRINVIAILSMVMFTLLLGILMPDIIAVFPQIKEAVGGTGVF